MATPLRHRQLNMAGSASRGFTGPGNTTTFAKTAVVLTVVLFTGPIMSGLAGTLVPALGYMPALGGHEISLRHFADLFAEPGIIRSSVSGIVTGIVSAAISLTAVALFLAARQGTLAGGRTRTVLSALLAVPHAAAAFGLAFLLAPSGWLVRILGAPLALSSPPNWPIPHDPWGLTLIAGLVVKEIPFLLLVSLSALPQVPIEHYRRLAASMGYGAVAGFFYIAWPQIYRQIRHAVFAVIAFASSVVDVALILGPDLPGPLAVRLLQWMSEPELSARFLAAAGAILQLAVSFAAIALWLVLERIGKFLLARARQRGVRHVQDRLLKSAGRLMVIVPAVAIGLGLANLFVWSFAGLWQFPDILPQVLTLRSWDAAISGIAGPLGATFILGAMASLIALCLTIGLLEHEFLRNGRPLPGLQFLLFLPLLVPQISFMFGIQLLFLASGTESRFTGLILAHVLFVLPYVYLSLAEPWRSLDRRYDMLGAAFGRSRLATLITIRGPMLTRAISNALAIGFAVSAAQYLPTFLVGEGRITTITTEAVGLASGGNRRAIGVYAILQSALPFAAFLLANYVPGLYFRNRRSMQV